MQKRIKNPNYYAEKSDLAEELKASAYETFYANSSFDEKLKALRTILRCHYVKLYCMRMNNSGSSVNFNEFKREWKIKESNNFGERIVECL